jgi:hypothetical protein
MDHDFQAKNAWLYLSVNSQICNSSKFAEQNSKIRRQDLVGQKVDSQEL